MIDVHDPRVIRDTTLLDWFAGQALTGLLASESINYANYDAELSERVWDIAESMVAERKKRVGKKEIS